MDLTGIKTRVKRYQLDLSGNRTEGFFY